MAGPKIQTRYGCGGRRGTTKVEHSVETDLQGNQAAVQREVWSPCSSCGGTGTVMAG